MRRTMGDRRLMPGLGLLVGLLLSGCEARAQEALSYGQGGCGRLEGGVQVACEGPNYRAFSGMACTLGRNWLHPAVVATLTDAYAALARELPSRQWQYGDLGWEEGGRLRPHRTHQSGVAADFFVPVRNAKGQPAVVPIRASEKFGYSLDFDPQGRLPSEGIEVDFKALAAHLLALEVAGKKHGVRIERVIVTPDFHKALFAAEPKLRPLRARFMKKEAWVRHDEHYHVDFALPAALKRPLRCEG